MTYQSVSQIDTYMAALSFIKLNNEGRYANAKNHYMAYIRGVQAVLLLTHTPLFGTLLSTGKH